MKQLLQIFLVYLCYFQKWLLHCYLKELKFKVIENLVIQAKMVPSHLCFRV